MAVTVDVYVKDTTVSAAPINGVVVGVFDPNTYASIAAATTDNTGHASFLLPGSASPGTTYELRFFEVGVYFANPVLIQVLEPVASPNTNIFNMTGVLVAIMTPATDPTLCRVQGRLMNFSNQPIANATVRFMAEQDVGMQVPKYVNGNLVSASEMLMQSDANGFISVDLFRGGEYEITFSGEDETTWQLFIPNQPLAALSDLVNPYPVSIAWDQTIAPGNVINLNIGASLYVDFTALFSDYRSPLGGLGAWLIFSSSDLTNSIITAQQEDMGVKITAIGLGTAQITGANLPNLFPNRIPYYSTFVPALVVNVI